MTIARETVTFDVYDRAHSATSKTIAFLHAHPDDEALLTAGTMAKAVDQGHRVILIVATDGGAGLTSSSFRKDLASQRHAELLTSAEIIGIDTVHSLGYQDSGMLGDIPESFAMTPLEESTRRLNNILEADLVDILVGYDQAGGYGHPDHLQVHRLARMSASQFPQLTLFEATLPREPIVRAVNLAVATGLTPSDFDSDEFKYSWTPRRLITHRVNVRSFALVKKRAIASHASQAHADNSIRTLGMLNKLPMPLFSRLLGTEYFVKVP